jgi:hypothetical protein|tara:strand:- start:465 stop:626 length:162 start_codon:yes stop_codon:yes gene_type:complete
LSEDLQIPTDAQTCKVIKNKRNIKLIKKLPARGIRIASIILEPIPEITTPFKK